VTDHVGNLVISVIPNPKSANATRAAGFRRDPLRKQVSHEG
jgi:hypothetical protein